MTRRRPALPGVLLVLLTIAVPLLTADITLAQPPVDYFLHGTGPDNNPPTLLLNTTAPTATNAKFRDSASVNFSGGNPWKDIGTWPAASSLTSGTLTALSDLHVWLGLKNSDDQGTQFDLRAEISKNGTVVASGLTRCITGLVRNANQAKEVTVAFGSVPSTQFNGSTDTLAVKILTRIGTNPDDTKCPGHNNAVGLRLYFDATSRNARFDATLVTVPAPTITNFTPTSGQAGDVVTVTGTNFVNVQSVTFNGVAAAGVTVTSPTSLTATVPAGALTGPIAVTTASGTATSAANFTVFNPPALAPIGNQTVALGSTLTFTVTATDPNNDPVSFAVTPLPLPAHATFHTQTGLFTFTPEESQVGTISLTFLASDGMLASSEPITITVTGAQPGGISSLTGRVDDTSQHPLANLAVSLLGTALTTTTAADGTFTLTSATMPTGRQQLVVTGLPQNFANLVAPVDIIANVSNQLVQPLTLPPIDTATTVTVNPAVTTILTSASLNVTVTIPAGTAKNPDGTPYTGQLTISPVPEYGRPESRPIELKPGLSVTIQPAGVVFDPPAAITFPNVDTLGSNTELDLWSLSPDTGNFNAVAFMRVSADGQRVETVSGGVRKSAWHFALPAGAVPGVSGGEQRGQCTECESGSRADLSEGNLVQRVVVPGVRTVGVTRDLTFRYQSTSADVRPILPADTFLSSRVFVPPTFSARLTIGGVQQGADRYWTAATLPQGVDNRFRLGLQMDGSSLSTGLYPYELMVFSNYPQSSIGGGANAFTLIRNEQQSPFGAGWTVEGLDRLYPHQDDRLVLAEGTGGTKLFGQSGRPIVIESFNVARSFSVSGVSMSFVAGTLFTQAKADLQNPANFGPTGIVQRPVTFGTGIQTITTAALTGVDLFILNDTVTPLSASEIAALEQFVAEGGALLELSTWFASARPVLLGSFMSLFSNIPTASLTAAGLASPLAMGAFGTVTAPLVLGGHRVFDWPGLATVIADHAQGRAVLSLQPGAGFSGLGRAVLIGDEEVFASGHPTVNNYTAGQNKTAFLNTIAFLAQAPGFRIPPPASGGTAAYQGPSGEFSTITKNPDGTYTRTLKDGTTYQFNAQGLQTAVVDRNNNQTVYTYDGQGRLTTITDPVGRVTTLGYTGGRLSSLTDPAGRVTQFQHDATGNLIRVTDPASLVTAFAYDPQHRLTQRTDARGKVFQYAYDYTGRFTQATLPTSETRSLSPSQRVAVPNLVGGQGTQGNPAALGAAVHAAAFTDGRNNTTSFETDAFGRVTKQTDALTRVTAIQRDAQGNPTLITRPNGAVTTLTYDSRGNLLTSTEPAIAATTGFLYEPTFNQVTRITDPKGNQTTLTYDARGNPLTITDADNQVTTFTYDSRGLLLTSKDALNQTTTFTYDALGRLLTTTDPLNRTTTLTYDAAGNVATSTDALNRVTSFTYDAFNRLTTVTDPAGGLTTYTYDGNGNLLTVKDAKNQTTTFTYDDVNRLASTTDPLGKTESYTYDGADNLLTRVTPKGDQISFAYDAVNQVLSKTLPGSLVTSYSYDAVGNLLTVTDPDSQLTLTYDLANRLLSTSTAGSSNQPAITLSYTYDLTGNRTKLTSPTGNTTYSYDTLNRLTTLFTALGGGTCPAPTALPVSWWPAQGTADDLQDANPGSLQNGVTFVTGQVGQTFSFDGVDDFIRVAHHPSLDPGPGSFTVSAWVKTTQASGFLSILTKYECGQACPSGIANSWYGLGLNDGKLDGRVRDSDASGPGIQVLIGTRMIADGQWHHVAMVRDIPASQLRLFIDGTLEVQQPLNAGSDGQITDDDGEPDPLLIAAFPVTGSANGSFFFQGQVDEVKFFATALTTADLVAEAGCPPQPGLFQWVYDALSRRTSLTLPNGTTTTYTYDPASQVTNILHQLTASATQINKADYVYNGVGNRTSLADRRGSQNFGYDTLDRLTSASHPLLVTPQAFAYDAVGNRTTGGSVVNAGNQLTADANFAYIYDDNGNLTRKTFLATGNFTQYTYDAENRLTKVEDFLAGNPTPTATSTYHYDGLGRRIEKVANGQTKRYIYDGEDILLEYDGTNTLQARYTHGPGIDEPIAVTKGGSTFFYHQDGLGTVTDLTDSIGATAKSYSYDAYGNILESPGTLDQPYTYTGREFDSESGLYYLRARYYDPTTGRFLQKDPIGLGGGDINFYNYVRNNPPRLADPFGLFDFATPGEVLNFWGEFFGAIGDFGANYVDMRQAWWKGADKYFHCKANCQAAQRGVEGEAVACIISDIREWWDQNVKSYWDPRSTPQDSAADQQANLYGRLEGSINPGTPCEQSCAPFRPVGLPPQY